MSRNQTKQLTVLANDSAPAARMAERQTIASQTCFHVTVLSNFARGYDKYRRNYDKVAIPESTFPEQFFLLSQSELQIGITKATTLLRQLSLPDDRLLVISTQVPTHDLKPNHRTGLGRFVKRSWIRVDRVFYLDDDQNLIPQTVEDVTAHSFETLESEMASYDELTPRSFSVLPEAIGCQASCSFCFSKASVSLQPRRQQLSHERMTEVIREAKRRGASRGVITGGGEPGILEHAELETLIGLMSAEFDKTVLITNGYKWSSMPESERLESLLRLDAAGLHVLAISRHHHCPDANSDIMRLNTRSEVVADTWQRHHNRFCSLNLRWICVLQRGGIQDEDSLRGYIDWAARSGVGEICFKELYVSTSSESEYHDRKANQWSHDNQVPLCLVTDFVDNAGWQEVARLPWGAMVFRGDWNGTSMQIAAYTEPALFWERHNRLCRSWNLMADGRCLASLEDRNSEVMRP